MFTLHIHIYLLLLKYVKKVCSKCRRTHFDVIALCVRFWYDYSLLKWNQIVMWYVCKIWQECILTICKVFKRKKVQCLSHVCLSPCTYIDKVNTNWWRTTNWCCQTCLFLVSVVFFCLLVAVFVFILWCKWKEDSGGVSRQQHSVCWWRRYQRIDTPPKEAMVMPSVMRRMRSSMK